MFELYEDDQHFLDTFRERLIHIHKYFKSNKYDIIKIQLIISFIFFLLPLYYLYNRLNILFSNMNDSDIKLNLNTPVIGMIISTCLIITYIILLILWKISEMLYFM